MLSHREKPRNPGYEHWREACDERSLRDALFSSLCRVVRRKYRTIPQEPGRAVCPPLCHPQRRQPPEPYLCPLPPRLQQWLRPFTGNSRHQGLPQINGSIDAVKREISRIEMFSSRLSPVGEPEFPSNGPFSGLEQQWRPRQARRVRPERCPDGPVFLVLETMSSSST